MKIFIGLFMAWGNFLTVPCPLKKWDNDLKNYMLGFLPSVGGILGLIWAGICLFLVWLGLPYLVLSFVVTFTLFALCGFMHLDGFMDCTDAIMSRKPIEDRQRILKDSHCGAFSVVSVVFMILAYYSVISTNLSMGLDFVDLCLIPIISRGVAGANVLLSRPIGHSQYAKGAGAEDMAQKKKASLLILIQCIIFGGIGLYFASHWLPSLLVMLVTAASGLVACAYAKRNLGGMSGDIAGFSIVWAELMGVFAMLIL